MPRFILWDILNFLVNLKYNRSKRYKTSKVFSVLPAVTVVSHIRTVDMCFVYS